MNQVQKKVIDPEEWLSQLDEIQVSKYDLNRLVMNFFLVEGYKEAAECLARESRTELSDFDITFMDQRIQVKQLIHQGSIDEAILRISALSPDVLQGTLLIQLQLQKLIETIKADQIEQALLYASNEVLPKIQGDPALMAQLEKIMCLLAFEQPAKSPLAALVAQSQRIKISSEVNTQLLKHSQNIEKESKLPVLLKLLVWQQKKLGEFYTFPAIQDLQMGQL